MSEQDIGCGYADLDGAYVLGALGPIERLAYEQHLTTCESCARSVRELAGLPGLLGRVDPVVLESPAPEPVPVTLLPALVAEVRRTRRRRLLTTAGLAAAAAIAVGALLVQGFGDDSPPAVHPSPPVARSVAMSPVDRAPVAASVAFTSVTWGTKLDLTCTYEPVQGEYRLHPSVTYGLFVVGRDGRAEQVGTWRALGGRTMRLSAATAARRADIASVEVRAPDGRPVLRLTS